MEYEVGVDESVTTAIVCAVSAVDGRQPSSLPPLSHAINPDALDALFESRYDGEPRIGGRLFQDFDTPADAEDLFGSLIDN